MNSKFFELTSELERIAHGLDKWYNLSKIKWYGVYVHSKDDPSENLFDIFDDKIAYYDDFHVIPPEAMAIVIEIQNQMAKINEWFSDALKDELGCFYERCYT